MLALRQSKMTDLFAYAEEQESQPEGQEPHVFTVSQLSTALRHTVEDVFGRVTVEGEIGSFRPAASGHLYFVLKDEDATIKGVVWRSAAIRLKIAPEDGLRVVAKGKLTTYAPRSEYQLVIDQMEPAGLGALMQLLEERKQKLAAEGLFDPECKQEIPYLPNRIGIITSPTGAVIEDMLHRIEARCPRDVILWPTAVQGQGAAEQIAAAIQGMNALPEAQRPDVLIVARGGGSFEDLMPFQEECVVRAVAASQIPVVSGVGHEPDVTLIDFVADVRAPTPTAAAELVVPVREDLLYTLDGQANRLQQTMRHTLTQHRNMLAICQKSLPDPRSLLTQAKLRLEDRAERLDMAQAHYMKNLTQTLNLQEKMLQTLAPDAPLKRGYLYATDENGDVIRSATTTVKKATLRFYDGMRQATLEDA